MGARNAGTGARKQQVELGGVEGERFLLGRGQAAAAHGVEVNLALRLLLERMVAVIGGDHQPQRGDNQVFNAVRLHGTKERLDVQAVQQGRVAKQ